jgi:hypothetical protein
VERWGILSRIKSEVSRKDCGHDDDYRLQVVFDQQKKAQTEYAWLTGHNTAREYILVRIDDLDDVLPY